MRKVTTPTHRSWDSMKQRCNNSNRVEYPRYGGRGITYDPKWETFEGFFEDMGERPKGMTLDRFPDTNGNYCKDNCRWATPRQQCHNKSNNNRVVGVCWRKHKGSKGGHRWEVRIHTKGKKIFLYGGQDFFEAVCAAKSFYNKDNCDLSQAPS